MRQSRSSPAARLFWAACLLLLALAIVLVVQHSIVADEADTATLAPPCRELDIPKRLDERVTCRTRTATVTLAPEDVPVVLEDTQARVLRSGIVRRTLRVALRLRNETDTINRAGAGRRQVYARIGKRRYWPQGYVKPAVTQRFRFVLPRRVARRVRRGRANVELGIVGWSELGRPQPARLGVIRLRPSH